LQGRGERVGRRRGVTRLLLGLTALLALVLIAQAIWDAPAWSWAAVALFAAVIVVRYEFWPHPGRDRRADRD
jgi:hypothetical protein